jgi:DNA-binding Xre family transcriptional regulator
MAGKLRNRLIFLLTEKERRDNRRISQVELAEAVGISFNAAGRWLRNEVERFDAPIIEKFCDYFGCEVGDLLYIDRE